MAFLGQNFPPDRARMGPNPCGSSLLDWREPAGGRKERMKRGDPTPTTGGQTRSGPRTRRPLNGEVAPLIPCAVEVLFLRAKSSLPLATQFREIPVQSDNATYSAQVNSEMRPDPPV
jgi:hypothetical protein